MKKQCDACGHYEKELEEKALPLDDGSRRYTGLPDFTSVCKKRLLRTSYKAICKWWVAIN